MGQVPLTLLTIAPVSDGPMLTPYSARGLNQTLEPIIENPLGTQIRRSINGTLIDLTYSQFKKYRSVITCTDAQAPAFDGAEHGQIVTVDCCAELSYKTSGGSPSRTVVTGSSRVEGDWTYYRPQLTMMVVGFRQGFDEWRSDYQWSLELEEV